MGDDRHWQGPPRRPGVQVRPGTRRALIGCKKIAPGTEMAANAYQSYLARLQRQEVRLRYMRAAG